jgi:hypothetical protein
MQGEYERTDRMTEKIFPEKQYTPRTALIALPVRDVGDDLDRSHIEAMLKGAGVDEIEVADDAVSAISYINRRMQPLDLLVIGEGMGSIAAYVEGRASTKGTYTIACAEDARADFHVENVGRLKEILSNPLTILRLYANNREVQRSRAEEEE